MGAAGEAVAGGDVAAVRARALRPLAPGEGEIILWEGRPDSATRRLLELLGFLLLMGLLSWLAIELIRPHFSGSPFAGQPDATALPLILAMVIGMMAIIAIPVWLRSSARGRARYMLTNRRALIWLRSRIVGEALLFGAEMQVEGPTVSFTTPGVWLDWRLKDEGPDRVRFERIADAQAVAAMAEEHGARWIDRPEPDGSDAEGSGPA